MASSNFSGRYDDDVIDEIFRRIPAKGIAKFKSLSKSFSNFLELPYFIGNHFDHYLRNQNASVQPLFTTNRWIDNNVKISMNLCREDKIRNIVLGNDMLNGEWYTQEWTDNGYSIANSCNGFVLFRPNDIKQPLILCNPLSLDYCIVPFCLEDHPLSCFVGLGFSILEKEYKLVGVKVSYEDTMEFMVYTFGRENETWRCTYRLQMYRPCRRPVYSHGKLFWICTSVSAFTFHLLSFDVETEAVFEINDVPAIRDNYHVSKFKLVEFGNWISIIYVEHSVLKIFILSDVYKSSWELKYSIELPDALREEDVESVWKENGKIHICTGKLILTYNEEEKMENFRIYTKVGANNAVDWNLCTMYKPSFASFLEHHCEDIVVKKCMVEDAEPVCQRFPV